MEKLTPPPEIDSPDFKQWLFKLRKIVSELSQPAEVATFPLSSSSALELTSGSDTTLHFHSSDRNRTNHTGTQNSSTISDFNEAVQSLITANQSNTQGGDSILAAQVFGF